MQNILLICLETNDILSTHCLVFHEKSSPFAGTLPSSFGGTVHSEEIAPGEMAGAESNHKNAGIRQVQE